MITYQIVVIYSERASRTGKPEHEAMFRYMWRRYLAEEVFPQASVKMS